MNSVRLQRVAILAALVVLQVLAAGASAAPVTSPSFPGVTCDTVMVPMRDGTRLATEVYLPVTPGQYPVVLTRNPYGRSLGGGCFAGYFAGSIAVLAQNGYVGLLQHVRGTFASEGVFNAYFQEGNDGYDAVEWAAVQPWSNGKVGITGASYLGVTAWQAAIAFPPHLLAIAASITASDVHDSPIYENGVLTIDQRMGWTAGFVPDEIIRTGTALGLPPAQIAQQVADWNAFKALHANDWLWQVPLSGMSALRNHGLDFYYFILDHPTYDANWQAMDVEIRYPELTIPALISGASYDLFNVGTIRNFQGMRRRGGSELARTGTKLVWQAYGHAGNSGTPSFGSDAIDPTLTLRFFDRYLKGVDNGFQSEPTVRIYVLVPPNTGNGGSGFWITGDDFPLPGTRTAKYFLRSGGHANTRLGDGVLVPEGRKDHPDVLRRAGAKKDRFSYDPMDPVPAVGGNMCCLLISVPVGAREQSAVELRDDVLVYTSAPLDADLAVIGMVKVTFWAKTSARDTDFTVKIVDVHPDNLTHNVIDRIVRARYRNGSKLPPDFVQPHKSYEYTIEVGNVATILRAGHQVRVEISSSKFPQFSRNLNTGGDPDDEAVPVVAEQTIMHNGGHESFIELPVAPGVTIP